MTVLDRLKGMPELTRDTLDKLIDLYDEYPQGFELRIDSGGPDVSIPDNGLERLFEDPEKNVQSISPVKQLEAFGFIRLGFLGSGGRIPTERYLLEFLEPAQTYAFYRKLPESEQKLLVEKALHIHEKQKQKALRRERSKQHRETVRDWVAIGGGIAGLIAITLEILERLGIDPLAFLGR